MIFLRLLQLIVWIIIAKLIFAIFLVARQKKEYYEVNYEGNDRIIFWYINKEDVPAKLKRFCKNVMKNSKLIKSYEIRFFYDSPLGFISKYYISFTGNDNVKQEFEVECIKASPWSWGCYGDMGYIDEGLRENEDFKQILLDYEVIRNPENLYYEALDEEVEKEILEEKKKDLEI